MGLRDLFRKHKKEPDTIPCPNIIDKNTKQPSPQPSKHDKVGLVHIAKDASL